MEIAPPGDLIRLVRPAGAARSGPTVRARPPLLALITLLAVACMGLTACTTNLLQARQENASLILSMYRGRPLAAVNNGQTIVGLHDCIRLAVTNNLDIQAALWDEQVKSKLALSSRLRMLPRVEGVYNLTRRDTLAWGRSDVLDQEGLWESVGPGPGTGVTNFSTGREQFSRNWQAQVLWSPMDCAMASYLAQARGNDSIAARYQRVRVAQQLVGTVTSAFWRLRALHEAVSKAEALEAHRRNTATDLKSLVQNALIESQEYLTAKTLLAEATQQLADTRLNIGKQRELLAVAMNVCPDSCFDVVGDLRSPPVTCLEPCKLEAVALVNRPEAYQADLSRETSVADQKRLIVKMFPKAEGFIGYFRDENKYLLNKNWIDGGLKVTWDLMDFAATLLEHGAAKYKVYKTDRDRAVVSLGILSQVRLKSLDALRMLAKYRKSLELEEAARETLRIAKDVEMAKERGASRKIMRIARERALCNVLQAEIDRLMALGDAYAALAEVDVAVGSNHPIGEAHPFPTAAVVGPMAAPYGGGPLGAVKRAVGCVVRGMLPL